MNIRFRSSRSALVAAIMIGVTIGPLRAAQSPSAAQSLLATSQSFQLQDLKKQARKLDEWSGQPLLINYWATWCAPCIKEMPELDAFFKSQGGVRGGVRVVAIAADDPDAVRAFANKIPVTFPILIETVPDGGKGSVSLFGHGGGMVPFSVLLDAQGKVIHSKAGPVSRELLETWVKDLRS